MLTQRDHLNFSTMIMGRVAARIVSHVYTHIQTQDLLFIARLRSGGTTDHMHMRRWTGEGLIIRGGAEV